MKKTLLKNLLIAIAFLGCGQLFAQLTTFSTGLEGWAQHWGPATPVSHSPAEGVSGDGALALARASNNSGFGLNSSPGVDANTMKFVRMRYKNESNATSFRFQGDSSDGSITETTFSIGANSNEYITSYFDLSSINNWSGNVTNLDILVRGGWVSGEGVFYLDEIEFIDAMPPVQYSEFIQNPSYDGPSGIVHLSGNSVGATRGITTAEAHDGTQSLRYIYASDATQHYWAYSDYEKVYPSVFIANSEVQIKMWVKTNRVTPITLQARLKLSNGGSSAGANRTATVTTTNTAMGWEEVTFDIVCPDEFDGVILWFNILYADETSGAVAENLNAGDIVYIDQMTAAISGPTAGIEDYQQLKGVSIYPNPASEVLRIACPEGSKVGVYNLLGAKLKTVEKASKSFNMEVSDLATGLYIVKVESEGKFYSKKIQIK